MVVEKKRPPRPALALGLALAALLLVGPGTAAAEKYRPAPQGDDVAFLQLGAVGELVATDYYRALAADPELTAAERATAHRIAEQRAKAQQRLNSLLGEDAIRRDDFEVRIPTKDLRARGTALALAARFERLLSGLYLGAVESTIDPPTRLLLGKRLAAATRNLAIVRGLRGGKVNLRPPKPLSVEYVGIQFDRFLSIPG